jgi:hypothetical protein
MLGRLGGIDFHGVAMKPGKSFVLGWLGVLLEASTPRVGLPFEQGRQGYAYVYCPGAQFRD